MIDRDVHQNLGHLSDLLPWLDPAYRDYLNHAGFSGFELPNYLTWIQPHGFTRRNSVPSEGGASSVKPSGSSTASRTCSFSPRTTRTGTSTGQIG